MWAVAAATLGLLVLPPRVLQGLGTSEDHGAPVLAAPSIAGGATVADAGLPIWTPAFVNPAAVFEGRYLVQERPVGLYIGYYRGQGPTRKLVSSINALVRSSDLKWIRPESGSRSVSVGERNLVVKTARLRRSVASSDSTALIVWQVYWINGRFESSDARAKAWGAWYRLTGRGDDGAVLVVYAQEREPGDADVLLERFVREQLGAIETQLRKTRDGD